MSQQGKYTDLSFVTRLKRKINRHLGKSVKAPLPPPQIADWNTKFDAALGPQKVELIYWPGYSNPYQRLFYGLPTAQFSPKAGEIDDAQAALKAGKADQVCFHIHWLNGLFGGADRAAAARKIAAFLEELRSFVADGGVVFWTVHNLQEHDIAEGPVETKARQEIVRLAQSIFVHGPAARDSVLSLLPEAAPKLKIIPHGNYIGVYPDVITPAAARRKLGLTPEDTVFANLGLVRKYKGVTALCSAVSGLDGAVLAVAGGLNAETQDEISEIFAATPQARLYPGWVPDTDLQLYLNAADFIALPYQASLTSGAAILALSFGVPVIAPQLGAFPEVIEDGVSGFLYDPNAADGLQDALKRAMDQPRPARAAMRVAAYEAAAGLSWSAGRLTLFQSLHAAANQAGTD